MLLPARIDGLQTFFFKFKGHPRGTPLPRARLIGRHEDDDEAQQQRRVARGGRHEAQHVVRVAGAATDSNGRAHFDGTQTGGRGSSFGEWGGGAVDGRGGPTLLVDEPLELIEEFVAVAGLGRII